MSDLFNKIGVLIALSSLIACGEPEFENAGSQASLFEDREGCAAEIDKSPAANAYRQNPDAHPEFPVDVFNEMNLCIERKGWKQVRSQEEQEKLREEIVKEARQEVPTLPIADSKTSESFVHAVKQRLERSSSYP